MPTYSKIILTNTAVPSAVPDSSDLSLAELAINYHDGKLFYKDTSGEIAVLASSVDTEAIADHLLPTNTNPHNITKETIGLGNVENTSDSAKPISITTQAALDQKASLGSVDNLETLSGVNGATHLGIFTGSTITDNTDIKDALQDLETEVEAKVSTTTFNSHTSNVNNPHDVTKAQVDLGKVENLSPAELSTQIRGEIVDDDIPLSIARSVDVANLEILSGVNGATDLGTFTGSTIADNRDIKDALQDLETSIEAKIGSGNLSVGPEGTASGDGSISYTNGVFTYTPPTLDGLTGTVPVANGGTGATTDAAARTNLGLVIGTDVQAHDAILDATTASFTIADEEIIDGLGTISTQDANSVNIDGGAIDGTTIGATTASTGKFTSLEATSITTANIVASQEFGFKNTPTNAVTQSTSITTGVTINSPAGTITCVGHAFSTNTPETFTVSNDKVSETDVIILSFKNGYEQLAAKITDVSSGSFNITIYDYHNQAVDTTSSPIQINFAVIRHDIT